MTRLIVAIILLTQVACATNGRVREKAWITDYVNTGEFTQLGVKENKILFTGSKYPQYSNVSYFEVQMMNQKLLRMLQGKYGKNNIVFSKSGLIGHRYFEFSYQILKNKVTKSNHPHNGKRCFSVSRELQVELGVRDVMSGHVYWGGKIDKRYSDTNCNARTHTQSTDFVGIILESLINSAVDSAFDAALGTYPVPPSVSFVAGKIFYDFYENMP